MADLAATLGVMGRIEPSSPSSLRSGDPRSCICADRDALDGDDARSYARAHLAGAGRVARRPALRCPSTGVVWLRLPPEPERRDRGHVLVRASDPVAVPRVTS